MRLVESPSAVQYFALVATNANLNRWACSVNLEGSTVWNLSPGSLNPVKGKTVARVFGNCSHVGPEFRNKGAILPLSQKLEATRMSELPNEEIEGRLNAQRETLALVVALLASLDTAPERIWAELEARFQFQNSQEDRGVLPSSAFSIEAAKMREFKLIAEEARARNAEWNGRDKPQGAG
ncbi:hypothetical protein NKI19_30155 [Mesorhizobium sp. M0751]|uniref:hypothetical protein n=1 Tax=unclassified Mesorhizobium TaxID=325217 RepID=UPI003338CFC2